MAWIRSIPGAGYHARIAGDGERSSALRAGRIFDTPPLKGLTFASDR